MDIHVPPPLPRVRDVSRPAAPEMQRAGQRGDQTTLPGTGTILSIQFFAAILTSVAAVTSAQL
jgi:hypothetical protein